MGFFYVDRKKEKAKRGIASAETLRSLGCNACPLDNAPLTHPKMDPTGSNKPLIYVIGEAPGKLEDAKGVQFIGPSGQLLRSQFTRDQLKQTRFNNTIHCRPPDNRNPTFTEIECCRNYTLADIEQTKPKAIFTFGQYPLSWVNPELELKHWRGKHLAIQIGSHQCWLYPHYHPSFILRQAEDRGRPEFTRMGRIFVMDLRNALDGVNRVGNAKIEAPSKRYENIKIITGEHGAADVALVKSELAKLAKLKLVAHDIETNGFRPYAAGAKILSIAIGTYDHTIAIALKHKQAKWTREQYRQVRKLVISFLRLNIAKIAHNLAFELEWYAYFYGKKIVHSHWEDTMAQAYIIHERTLELLSLDWMCYQHFGLNLKLGAPDRKNLDNEPLDKVLYYNGGDVKYTHKLFLEQQQEIEDYGLVEAYQEQIRRTPTLVLTQLKGVHIDQAVVKYNQAELEIQLADVDLNIGQESVVHKFIHERGKYDVGSHPDNLALFRDYLGCKEVTSSVAEPVLEKVEHSLARFVLDWRKLTKLKSTYVDQFVEGTGTLIYPDGLVHPQFNSLITDTGRLSSSNPNHQNWPVRKDGWIRKCVVAPKGHVLLKVDYGQIEARVIGMMSKDPVWVKALWEKHDVHMDWARKLAHAYPRRIGGKQYLTDKTVMKTFRTDIKNQWTFPLFYGCMLKSAAEYLSIPEFVLKPYYDEFWDEFSGVKEWQEQLLQDYNENGYVECVNGRRRHAPLSPNRVYNTPVQGTSSDIVVNAMDRLSEDSIRLGKEQYQAAWNVHDDLTFYIPEDSFEEDFDYIIRTMLYVPYDWAQTVPISLEAEIGYNWYEMESIGTYYSNTYT